MLCLHMKPQGAGTKFEAPWHRQPCNRTCVGCVPTWVAPAMGESDSFMRFACTIDNAEEDGEDARQEARRKHTSAELAHLRFRLSARDAMPKAVEASRRPCRALALKPSMVRESGAVASENLMRQSFADSNDEIQAWGSTVNAV